MKKIGLIIILLIVSVTIFAQSGVIWEEIPGIFARDIAIGGSFGSNNDAVYAIEKLDGDPRYGGYVYNWNGKDKCWYRISGLAVAISVSPAGIPWVVNAEGKIFEWVYNRFLERPGYLQSMRAIDIGIGYDGIVMIINRNNGHIYQWNGSRWSQKCTFYSGATRIDVDYLGTPWVVNSQHFIFNYKNGRWYTITSPQNTPRNLKAWDVGASLSGAELWISRADKYNTPEGGPFYYTVPGGVNFYGPKDPENSLKGVRIDVRNAVLWMVNGNGQVFRGEYD
jgi:hypothetical protein